jgi:hypothetical protein
MKYNEIKELAAKNKLQFTEVTSSPTGYPEPITGAAVWGFESFKEVQDFVEIFGGVEMSFKSKGGWQFVNREGQRYEAYQIHEIAQDWNSYNIIYSDKQILEEFKFKIQQVIDVCNSTDEKVNPDDLFEILNKCEKIDKALLPGTALVIDSDLNIVETLCECLEYTYDTNRYQIGVYFDYSDSE